MGEHKLRRGLTRRMSARAGAVLAACAVTATLAGCGSESEESLGENTEYPAYLVSSPLETTNAASRTGASTNAELVSGRVFPAVYTPGPNGQMIPNTDLVQARPLPGPQRSVVYRIADDAAFSDGAPVTCTDFYLAWAAGKHADLFDAQLPWAGQVEGVDCRPSSREFTVRFVDGGGGRWRQIFGPGEVLPAHAIARRAGTDEEGLVRLIDAGDPAGLKDVARVWREGFDFSAFDPELQVGYGPYRVAGVGEHGEVHLTRNEHYNGEPAVSADLVVWPPSVDPGAVAAQARVVAADLTGIDDTFVDRDNPGNRFEVHPRAGYLTESLLLAESGVFAEAADRDAFNACVDQRAVAAESSRVSGVDVPATAVHVVTHDDPAAHRLAQVADPHLETDAQLAGRLRDRTVRIGYIGPDPRKAAMVESVKDSCAASGITVEDVSATTGQIGDLAGVAPAGQDKADAILKAVDPVAEYPGIAPGARGTEALRAAEAAAWGEVRVIPLAAQPRVYATDKEVGNVSVYTGLAGIGWNMDRWRID